MIYLKTPLTKEDLKNLHAGDICLLSGTIYTARDQAHKRLVQLIEENKAVPFDLKNSIIYYTGPTPKKPGTIVGSIGPTSSYRMDGFMEILGEKGQLASIGKGNRSQNVIECCKKYQMVYFVTTGGIGAKLSKCVIKNETIAFDDLGPEAIRLIEVKDFPLIVGYDMEGNSVFKGENEND